MKPRIPSLLGVLTIGLAVVVGCTQPSGPTVETVQVSGTVYLDEKPLSGVSVHFFATKDHEGIGVTGPDGKYTLDNGAQTGQNKVYFSKVEGRSAEEMEMDEMESVADIGDEDEEAEPEAGQVIPAKYNDPEKTEVTYDVPAGGTLSADFKLTSD
jgi:hypothetical protein